MPFHHDAEGAILRRGFVCADSCAHADPLFLRKALDRDPPVGMFAEMIFPEN